MITYLRIPRCTLQGPNGVVEWSFLFVSLSLALSLSTPEHTDRQREAAYGSESFRRLVFLSSCRDALGLASDLDLLWFVRDPFE